MATNENNVRKYLSLERLAQYDALLKAAMEAADEAVLEAAKEYANNLDDIYDAAGTAASAVDTLVNEGQVKTNTDAIDAINDANEGILKQAQNYADGKHATAMGAAGTASDAAAAAQAAADAAQAAADAAQKNVDALVSETEGSVGRIPALEGRADALEDTVSTLVGDDTDKSVRTIANEELAKQLIPETAAEALNELQEIAAWIQEHPGDAAAMNKAIEDLEALVGTLPEGVDATTVVGYIQEVVADEKDRAELAEGSLSDRLGVVEGLLAGEGDDTVDARIAAAKQEAINTAAGDATTKAGQALTDAKGYTDDEIGKVEETLGDHAETLEDLDGRVGANEDAIGEINTSLAENGDTYKTIAAAQAAADAAQGNYNALVAEGGRIPVLESRVDALEEIEWTEITESEVAALFETVA